MEIVTVASKKNEKFLRQKTEPFVFGRMTPREINKLVRKMRLTMKNANGIGLSANQIGLNLRMFVAQVPDQHGLTKFYSIFNPEIEKSSKEISALEEGCLSVPNYFGAVERPEKITLTGQDKNGKKIKIKAWGLLARVFQHETDHLNGVLFIDKARSVRQDNR